MRYAKDSIRLSESQDYPLLKQVLRSEFATQGQLFQFMSLGQREWSRRSFDWRLRRLVDHLLVERSDRLPSLRGEMVYHIAPTGAAVLQGLGEYCLFAPDRSNSRSDGKREQLSVLHSLELNEIHLSLLRKNPAAGWTYATEIRSQNELTRFGYAKDYDAVMTLHVAEQEVRIALEYERTPKATRHYQGIASALGRETHVRHLLYLLPNYDLLNFVSEFFTKAKLPVYFGLARDWHVQLLEMPVVDPSSRPFVTLSGVLTASAPGCQASQSPAVGGVRSPLR